MYNAVDVSEFDILDFECYVSAAPGTNGTITIRTGMSMESDDDWTVLVNFSPLFVTGSSYAVRVSSGIMRYVRFQVPSLFGTEVVFTIKIIGRAFEELL